MRVKDKFRYIVVEGPIGVGKTALARSLAETLDDSLLLERSTANPFLPEACKHPGSAALPVQLHFLFEHVKQVRGLRQADLFVASRVADFLIQAHRLFAEATLSQDELDLYYEVYGLVVKDISVPDLVIYLQSSVDLMVKRIRANGGVLETKIDREYLQKISDGYSDFFYHYDASSLLIVNTTHLDFASERGDYDMLLDYMDRLRPGRHYFNPQEL
jgi:deoxyadenosine/deoxycytidine kinase